MGATLDALHRLQEIELQLAEVQGKIDKKHRAVKRQEERIAQIDADIATIRAWEERGALYELAPLETELEAVS